MVYLIAAFALLAALAASVLLMFGATFALGAAAPGLIAKGSKLRMGFLAANLVLWVFAAALGANLALMLSPLGPSLTIAAFAGLLLASVASSAVRHRKRQNVYYQAAVGAACLAGIAACSQGLLRIY